MIENPSFRNTRHISGDLIMTARLVQNLMSYHLAPLGITYAQAVALVRLWRRGGSAQQRELIESLALSRASGTLVLNELEDAGFVRRLPDKGDARRYIVELTGRGAAIEPKVLEAFDQVESLVIDGVDRKELAVSQSVLLSLLHSARGAITDMREGS